MRLWAIAWALAAGIGVRSSPAAEAGELRYVPDSTQRVCQLTGDFDRAAGMPTLSQTDKRFGVAGTDLGSSFEHKGKLYFLFGDTWGRSGDQDVLGWTQSMDPSKITLQFHRAKDGLWLPLTVPRIEQGTFEVPSGGISIADTMYAVCTTDHSPKKVMGRSVLARSRDEGRTFEMLYELSNTRFINVAFWLTNDWLYIYGSGEYRKSNVCLARVKPAEIEDRSKLEYFGGTDLRGHPRWSVKEADAVPLFEHEQIGEFSVSHLKPVERYVMLYNATQPRGITLRSAEAPWGPWSKGTVIFDPDRDNAYGDFMHLSSKAGKNTDGLSDPKREAKRGSEYGPYIMSRFTSGAGGDCRIYYAMSTWNPYQVMVMRSDLHLNEQ